MTKEIVWHCDGCGDQKVNSTAQPENLPGGGWKHVTLQHRGLAGFPSGLADGEIVVDLCPSCARHLVSQMNPRRWPRAKPDQPHG